MRDENGLQYFLTDHPSTGSGHRLGSTVAVTDASGTLTSQQRYLPFGGLRTDIGTITQTDLGYTGQRALDSGMGGLMDYKARFYSPLLGRFTQPDSILPSGVQGLNRYSYVLNNPINANDPSGHKCVGEAEECSNNAGTKPINAAGSISNSSSINGSVSGGGGSPGHEYWTNTHQVCLDLPGIVCTEDEVYDYLSRFQYPGELPWQTVKPGNDYNVFPEEFNGYKTPIGLLWPGSGAIRVDKNGNIFTNFAYQSHIFDGVVDRIISRGPNGQFYVTTHGYGTNTGFQLFRNPKIENQSILVPGSFIDKENNNIGRGAFNVIDFTLIIYTTLIETSQTLSHNQQFPQ